MTELDKLRAENAALQKHVARLREALEKILGLEESDSNGMTDFGISQDRWRIICRMANYARTALSSTPEPRMLTELREAREALSGILQIADEFSWSREDQAKETLTRLDTFLKEFE